MNNAATPPGDMTMRKILLPVLLVGALLGTAACNPYDPASRGAGGALLGAGSGAALGAIAGGGRGAAIGAIAGGLVGGAAGVATTPQAGPVFGVPPGPGFK